MLLFGISTRTGPQPACISGCFLLLAQAALAQFAKAFGPHHGLLLKLRDTLLRAADVAQQWELALRTARELLPTYQIIYKQVRIRRATVQ